MSAARQWLTANRLQVLVTVTVALLLTAATWASAQAAGRWQQATREAARSATARVETVRFVYQSELPLAIGVAQAQVRRDAVRSLGAQGAPEVAGESAAADRLVAQLRMNAEQASNRLAHSDDYRTADGGYDVPRRLGDALRADQVTALDTSAVTMRAGDEWARRARGWALLALAVAAAFVVQAFLRGRRRRRREQPSAPDVGLIPTPWDEPRRRRRVAVLALAAWLALPLLTVEQLALSADSARSAAQSSLLITQLSGSATASQVRDGAAADLKVRGIDLTISGLTRQYAALLDGSRGQQLLGLAEQRAGERWAELGTAMTRAPGRADGVDAITVDWLASQPSDWERIRAQQERVQLAAERAGSSGDAVALSLLMAALAATAATVARLPGAQRRSAQLLAAGLLGAATLVALAAALR